MLLNSVLELHDVRDAERMCRRILDNHLRKTRATLPDHEYADCLTYLIETIWRLSEGFDPARNSSFSKYAYSILTRRVVDWYRGRFYRDQTSTDWYRRNNPNSTPTDPDERRNFHFPESLDFKFRSNLDPASNQEGKIRTYEDKLAADDRGEHDSLGFAVGTLTGDPTISCDPALADVLARGSRGETPNHHLRHPRLDAGTQNRNRDVAA